MEACYLTPTLQKLRHLYILCYTIGSIGTCLTLALLLWVAVCIAFEMEPLASISFLPAMPTFAVFILIFAVLAISIASWQAGANYHQQYETWMKKNP